MLAADEIKRLLAVANEPFEDEEDNEAVAASEPRLNFATQPEAFASLDNRPAEQEAEDEEGAVAIEDALASVGAISTPEYRSPRTMGEELSVGFDRGIDQTQGLGYGFVGLLGQAVGLKGVEEYGVENYLRKMEEAALNEASVRDPFEEIDDLGDAGLYAAGIIGEQIPQLLASALGGGIGGLAAKTIGKRVVSNMINKRVSAGLAGQTFADDAARAVATGNLRAKAAEDVAKETAGTLLANAGRAGGVSGAYLANFGQISGGSFGQMAQELGRGDAGIAAGFAVPGAALDTLGEVFIASKFLKPFSKAQRAAAEGVDTSLSLGRIGGGAATGFAAGSVIEGGTEGVQTGLEQAALGAADPNRTIEDVVMTPEAGRERLIAAAAGATVGGPLGGVGGGFEVAFSPRTTQTLNDRARQTQTDQTSSGVLTGDWSQPVQVDDVTMQRNSSGVWAALNPAEDLLEGIPRVQAEDGTSLLVVSPETGDQASFLVARAEKALSDLNEGDLSPDFQSQDESQTDPEDDLGEATELSEETEATRLRQSALGAEALRQQLGETEVVAAALAEPPVSTEQPWQPIKPASESSEVIDAALSEEEQLRQGEVGAMGVRIQAGRQEKVASKIMAPDVDTGEALQRVRNAGVVGDQADILLSNFYEKRKKELETAQEDRRKASEAALARPPVEAENFIKGLNTGDRVGLIGGQDRTATMFVGGVKKTKKVIGARETTPMVFVGRRKNGNAVFETFATSPADGGQVGSRTRLELPPAQFARVTLAPPPQSNRTPLEQAFDDALGPNPTKQQAERVLGSPYTGTRGSQESMFSDGMGESFPIEVSWFNKKGEKGTIIPSIKGKFTNSALTTVRQMNQGLEIVVPDDQLASVKKDIQIETVSDKKGGRKNIVTGVNLWGRTYRRSLRSPKEFSVNEGFAYSGSEGQSQRDIAEKLRRGLLTQEQATKLLSNLDEFGRRSDLRKTKPSKSGLLIFNDIYKNSPERIARSQAAVRGAQERQTPPEQMLREWELVQAGLNPVEYTFYEDALGRATDFINRSNLSENVKDEARFEAQNKIVKDFGKRKKRRGKQPAEGNAALAKIYLEELEKLRGARLDDSRKRATRLIGNIERNPERMSDVEIARADDADPLRGPVEGSVAGPRAAAIEERAIDEALKGNAVDLDRAVEATLKRLGKEQPNRTPKEVFNTRANLRSIATSYKNLGKFNPIYTAMNAVNTAVRSIRRREMNEQTELITDREARELASRQPRTQDPATTQEFAESEIDLAQRADTMQSADRVVLPTDPEPEVNDTAAEINPDEPLLDQLSDARGRYYDLSEDDQILALRNRTLIKNERGKAVRGQKSSLTSAQKRRAKQIEQYLQNKQTYADLYPKSTAPSRRPNQPAAALPLGRFSTGEVLAGVAESPARGRAGQDPQGRPESVGGPDRTGTGTVPGANNVRDGGSGVRASLAPQTVRGLSRAAKFRFVQSFGGLTDAEAAALTQAEIDLAYEAVTTRKRAGAVLGGRTVVGTTPKSLADLATMSGSELLAGATEARRAYEADREAVQVVRDNVGELLRTRAFADINTFLGAIGTSRLPRDLKLRAREFAKLTARGVDLNGVGVQIGRFGGDTSWAGIMTRETGDGYAIAINLDALQDRDSAVNTILHELSHVVSAKKIAGEVRLNKVERDALNRLEALRREAVIAAARDLGFDVPRNFTDADIQRLSQDLANRSNDPSGNNRVYNSLKDLTEFTTEISSNPELAGLMARLGFGQAKGKVTLLNAVRDAWNALVELIAGIKADPNSPLAKAFKDSWILNYSNAGGDMNLGDYTMPEIRRSTINREMARRQVIEDEINREVEARNLAGTTAEREAILNEMFDPSVTASAARVQRAANRLSQDEFVQWAQKSGYKFVDPVVVYNNNRTSDQAAEQQATGDTVQVAESRAVTTSDGEFHELNKVEVDGLMQIDPSSQLIASMREKASEVTGQVYGGKFVVVADGEKTEFGNTRGVQNFLGNIASGSVARVFRNGNQQIVADFDAVDRLPKVAESRARGRVTPPVPSKAEWEEEIGEELIQANTILKGKAPLKLIKVRDDLDYDTSYISGTHIFKTPEGDIITASKEDGQWDMQSIFNGEVSTFEEDAITYALERLSEELAEKRMMLAGDVYDEFLDMPKDHPFWSSDLATMDLEDAPKVYRMIDYYNSLPKQSTSPDIRESRARGRRVDTNADKFKQWFKQSAVTNRLVGGRNDQPLRMYHGSPFDLQSVFRSQADLQRDLVDTQTAEFLELNEGIYFTPRPEYAGIYAGKNSSANTTPVYLSIQNPYFVNERDSWWKPISQFFQNIRLIRPDVIKSSGYIRPKDLKRLRDQGYDGVINIGRGLGAASEVVVFSPTQIKSAITNTGEFSSTNPDIRESRARGRVWRERVRVTPTGGTISQGGMFAVDELLDKRAGDAYRSSRMAIKADISVIQELSRLLERQMKSLYKGQTAPLETINTALGNLENPLNSQQLEEIERLFNAKKTKQASDKRDQFIRENRKRFREVTQPAALAQLPEELASTIREMSSHIASLSKRLPNEGLVSGDLAITVEEALGMYLNRSYAIFDDPKWVDRVRKMPKVMDAARKFIRNSLINQKAKDLVDEAATSGRTLPFADAKRMANDSVTDADIEATLEGYLAVGDEAPSVEVLSGRIPGQKNLSMLTPRGNIAPEIQALWGRYEDPQVNYAKTVMKLSSVIANNQFLTELRDMGVEEGWLWSSKNNPDDLRHPPGYIKISSEGNPALTPLGGMYAHPMLAEGLFKMFPVGSTDQHYWWLQSAMKLTGISMAVKTVGSVASQIRNYLGNYLNLIATGNLGLGDIASGDFKKRFNNSTDTVLANTFNKYRNATRAEWRAKIDDYIRRGIVGESVTTGLLEDLLTASRKAGSPDFGDVVWNKVSEPFKRVADFAVKTYSSGDDWFKVMIYEAEQDKYRRAHPDWDDNKIKDKAAEISRDIHWTYSLAPSIVQDLKKFPFVAPFVTFTTEVIRTTYNLQKLARQEIMEGRASGNKELEAIGWKRVRGMTTAAFLPAAVGSTTMALAGISEDDEEDLRRFLPDWQKNSQLMLFRKENGEVSFVDISFLDPYEYFKKPLTAFMRSLREGDNASEMLLGGTMAMVRQAVDPFTSEQIFAGAIMDVMRNQDAAGRQVYNPQDTGANIGTAVARKIFIEPFTPGTFTSLDRIGKAAFGVQSESGRAYGLFNELASVMAGQRVSEMDAQQALQFKGSRFMREMRDASALFNREFVSQGTRSASDVVSGYERSNGARRALIGSIRKDYLAAIRLGVPVARAKAILRDAGVGRETLRMATTGIYKPFEASEDSLSLVRARGKNDRITAYNQARRATPTKEVLP